MDYFDVNCMLGPSNTDSEPSLRTPEALIAEMDRVGIRECLVYASQARMGHPAEGNEWLLQAIRRHDRLYPSWVVLPPGTGEQPEPDELVALMRRHGVRAARMFPLEHNFLILERTLRPLLRALAAARIPLLIDVRRANWAQISLDWREIFALAEAHPDLPLVLLREGGSTARILFSVWNEFPNICLETSYLQQSRILEEIVASFGEGRLLFGTAMPGFDPGGPLSLLHGARISETQRAGIAHNNLRRLMGLPAIAGGRPEAWPCGPGGFRVFDIHGHLGRWFGKYTPDSTAAQIVARMDQLGIERLAISDLQAIGPDYRMGNDRVGEAVAAYPERFAGYAVFNPNYESEMQDEMPRAFEKLGCSGIKLHCMLHQTRIEDRRYRAAFRHAHERRIPVLCHIHEPPAPDFLKGMLEDFPGMKFIYAHIGGGDRGGLQPFLPVIRVRPNLYFDLAMSNMPRGVLAWLVPQVPPSQILFGSDYPVMEFTYQLGRVLHADIPRSTKQMILFENAAALFGLEATRSHNA